MWQTFPQLLCLTFPFVCAHAQGLIHAGQGSTTELHPQSQFDFLLPPLQECLLFMWLKLYGSQRINLYIFFLMKSGISLE